MQTITYYLSTMPRDKAKDDIKFNCRDENDIYHVSSLYEDYNSVKKLILEKCRMNEIDRSTHMEIYNLIREELNHPVPGES